MADFKIHYKKGLDPTILKFEKDSKIKELLETFSKQLRKELKEFVFYYKGSKINYENSEKISNSSFNSEDKCFNIFAVPLTPISEIKEIEDDKYEDEDKDEEKEDKEEEKNIRMKVDKEKYNDIICPYCKTSAIIDKQYKEDKENKENKEDDKYKFKIVNCENFHRVKDYSYEEYENYVIDYALLDEENKYKKQNISVEDKDKKEKMDKNRKKYNEIKHMFECQLCSYNKERLRYPKDKFFICSCGCIACNECHVLHNEKGHYMIDIDDINYFCKNHGRKFSSYCIDCNANICEDCKNHKGHDIKHYFDKNIQVKKAYVENLANKVKDQENDLEDFVSDIKKILMK